MNRRQVTYFLAIAEAGSFSRASARLHVAQPALSARLNELESSLGLRLFERHSRGVDLTAHGLIFLPHARSIEAAFKSAEEAVRGDHKSLAQAISIGVTPAIGVTILPALLDIASVADKKIDWNVQQAAALLLINMLVDGKLEAALMYHNPNHSGLRIVPLFSEDMVLVGLPSVLGPCSGDIPFKEVGQFDLVLDQKTHLLRQVIDTAAASNRVELNVRAEVNPLPAKRRLLERGCCTIIPQNAFAKDIEDGVYVARRIVAPRLPVTLFILFQFQIKETRLNLILSAVSMGIKKAGVSSYLPLAEP